MQQQLMIRDIEKKDWPFLEDIIRKTWEYDQFCPPEVAKAMSKVYFHSCLGEQSFCRVALLDGIPVGVIMAKADGQKSHPVKSLLHMVGPGCKVMFNKAGRGAAKVFSSIQSIYKQFHAQSKPVCQGTIVFFAVDSECRGHGVGKKLFYLALQYLLRQNVTRFYLYTDTTCNYGFYEHMLMDRVDTKMYRVPFDQKEDMDMYLYHGEVLKVLGSIKEN